MRLLPFNFCPACGFRSRFMVGEPCPHCWFIERKSRVLEPALPEPFACTMTWFPIEHRPLETGRYIIAHRSHAETDTFLSPVDQCWAPHTKFGWQRTGPDGQHSFRPTHCALIPDFGGRP